MLPILLIFVVMYFVSNILFWRLFIPAVSPKFDIGMSHVRRLGGQKISHQVYHIFYKYIFGHKLLFSGPKVLPLKFNIFDYLYTELFISNRLI